MILTNNGKAFLYATTNTDGEQSIWNSKVIVRFSDDSGDLTIYKSKKAISFYYDMQNSYIGHINGLHIVVGSGTTTPAVTDLALNNEITSSSLVRINQSSRNKNNRTGTYEVPVIMSASCTFENTSQSEVFAINEIGLCTYPVADGADIPTSFTNYPHYNILLAREVLNNPINIGPGETATFSITIA